MKRKIIASLLVIIGCQSMAYSVRAQESAPAMGPKVVVSSKINYRDMSLPTDIKIDRIDTYDTKIGSKTYKSYQFYVSGFFSTVTSGINYDAQLLDSNTLVVRVYGEQSDAEITTPFSGAIDLGPLVHANEKMKFMLVKAGQDKFHPKFVDLGLR